MPTKPELDYVGIYSRYLAVRGSNLYDGRLADYNWGEIEDPIIRGANLPYTLMFDEFSREIANSINQLIDYSSRLTVWSVVVSEMDKESAFETQHEFIAPLATVALNLPYVIRSRLIYATTHLAHQANRAALGREWVDDLPPDDEIYFDTADKYGSKWRSYKLLKRSLEKIFDSAHKSQTKDFRRSYNHRIPVGIGFGITQTVLRTRDSKTNKITYSIGGTAALPISEIAAESSKQCARCLKAYDAFKIFVAEHVTAMLGTSSPPKVAR